MKLPTMAGVVRSLRDWSSAGSADDWFGGMEPDSFGGFAASKITGKRVTERSALGLVTAYACINMISDDVAGLPPMLVRQRAGMAEALDTPQLLSQPDPRLNGSFEFFHRLLVSLLTHGNAFILAERPGYNPGALRVLHPSWVTILREFEGAPGGGVRYTDPTGRQYDEGTILHIPAFTIPGYVRGLSPIEYHAVSLGLAQITEEFGARFFGQGTHMSGVIEAKAGVTTEQAEIMAKSFQKHHSSPENWHLPGIVTGGEWKPVTVPPEQAQFLQTRQFQRVEVCNLYKVPAYKLDPSVTSTWGTGIAEMNLGYLRHTIAPWITRIEQAFSNRYLVRGQSLKLDTNALLRTTMAERYAAYKIGIDSSILVPDEPRAWEGLPPLPDGSGAMPLKPDVTPPRIKE